MYRYTWQALYQSDRRKLESGADSVQTAHTEHGDGRVTGWRDALPSDGLLAVVKRDCPTCVLVAPLLAELAAGGAVAVTQDDPAFPEGAAPPA